MISNGKVGTQVEVLGIDATSGDGRSIGIARDGASRLTELGLQQNH